jgi:hypothetical protein
MRKKILLSVAILGFSWPVAAQEEFTHTPSSQAAMSFPVLVWDAQPIAVVRRVTEHVTPNFKPRTVVPQLKRNDFTASPRILEAHSSSVMSMYEYTETPFVQHVLVPVVSFAGGRLQVGGYLRMESSENIQMGLPGCGSLPAWSVGLQNHEAVIVPRADASAGFNISFRLRSTGASGSGLHPVAAFNKAMAFVRGI